MEYSVSLRRNYNESLTLSFTQIDKDLRYDCYEYFNMDRSSTTNDDIIRLNCDSSNTNNKTITGIKFKKNFNGLISIGLKERRLSAHHMRFIDYSDCNCIHLFKTQKHKRNNIFFYLFFKFSRNSM